MEKMLFKVPIFFLSYLLPIPFSNSQKPQLLIHQINMIRFIHSNKSCYSESNIKYYVLALTPKLFSIITNHSDINCGMRAEN